MAGVVGARIIVIALDVVLTVHTELRAHHAVLARQTGRVTGAALPGWFGHALTACTVTYIEPSAAGHAVIGGLADDHVVAVTAAEDVHAETAGDDGVVTTATFHMIDAIARRKDVADSNSCKAY